MHVCYHPGPSSLIRHNTPKRESPLRAVPTPSDRGYPPNSLRHQPERRETPASAPASSPRESLRPALDRGSSRERLAALRALLLWPGCARGRPKGDPCDAPLLARLRPRLPVWDVGFECVNIGDRRLTSRTIGWRRIGTVGTVADVVALQDHQDRAVWGLGPLKGPAPEPGTHGIGRDAQEGGGLHDGHATVVRLIGKRSHRSSA